MRRTGGRKRTVLTSILTSVILLGACTPTTDISVDEDPIPSLPTSPITYASPPVTLDMRFEGELRITPDAPCPVAVETAGSAQCLAFPEGTTLDLSDPARPLLLMNGCQTFADGDDAEFFGVFLTWEGIEDSAQERYRVLAELPRDAATSDGIAVVGSCRGPSQG